MYRIELGPDDVGVFRSIEEMATAIKTGVITPKARIFHSASDKWLPIEFHPHYKKAREMAAGPTAPAPATSPAAMRIGTELPLRHTPPAAPSPIAGLPLIDVSTPSRPSAPSRPLVPEPVREPTPAPEPIIVASVEPEPAPSTVASLPVAKHYDPPVAKHYDPEPEVEPEPQPLEHVHSAEPYAEPVLAYPDAVMVHVEPAVTHFEPAPAPILRLPEPEREAIFLAVPEQVVPRAPVHVQQTASASADPAAHQPRLAEPLPPFQLPRVDLRLGQRRRPAIIAAAAVALAVSTHLALSVARPQMELGVGVPLPDLGPRLLRAERPAALAPTTATVLPASVPASDGAPSFGGATAFSAPQPQVTPPPADTARPALPEIAPAPKIAIAAPKTVTAPSIEGDLRSAAGLVARYDGAHATARAELDNGLRTAGFANLFASARLQPGGLRAARASVGTASAYVTRYRRRQADIEQAYRDSFDLLSNRNKWSDGQRRTWEERKVQQEHPEIVKLSSFLLQSLDSLYGLFAAQEAAYRVSDGTVTFDEAAASRAYGELKPWLDRRAHGWADVESAEPTTAARILRAMGTVKLPEGGSL